MPKVNQLRAISQKKRMSPGAGIVVLKELADEYRVLCLRLHNDYDIPKGIMESGESPIQAAIRETGEEAGIYDLDFRWGRKSIKLSALTIFIAVTTDEPTIMKNPQTGILEHDDADWLTFDEALDGVYGYLKPAIVWADRICKA